MPNSRAGTPTTHSIPSSSANSTRAVPRSCWSTTSSEIRLTTGATGSSACHGLPSSFSFLA